MLTTNNKPNLFILGAPKCGTSSLAYYLSQHPQVFVSAVKEPHYFNTDSGHRYYFEESSYLKLFEGATTEHAYRCEASVWYLYSERAVDHILKFNPQARFVVMLRPPVDLFLSLHRELLYGGTETVESPKEAWDLQVLRAKGEQLPPHCKAPELLQYFAACQLGRLCQRLEAKVKPKQRIYVLLEDLKNQPENLWNTVTDFLNLDRFPLSEYPVVNPKKQRASKGLFDLTQKAVALKNKLGLPPTGLARKVNDLNTSQKVEQQQPPAPWLQQLHTEFLTDIELLEQVIGRSLYHWKERRFAS